MGCACTRAAPGEKHRNDTNEQPTSAGANRYERVDNNANPETPQKSANAESNNTPASAKNPSNASFSKIMGNIFQKKNQSSAQLYNGSSANLIDPNRQAPNSPLLPNSSQDQSNLIENQSNAVLKRLNTVKKKLPANTINLLCGDSEFDKTSSRLSSLDPSKCQQFDKFNREIQLYLSLPYMSMQSSNRTTDALLTYHFKLFEKHLYENFESTSVVATLPSLYDNLCIYCAQKIKNCDLNVINLNYFNASTGGTVALNEKIFNLTANKYFRRMLSKSILNDLLNQSTLNNKNLISNYLCAPSMFVIFLSEYEMQKETAGDLLCPDEIEMNDFKSKIESVFSPTDLDLFLKWYRIDPKLNKYVLDIDYSSLINNSQANVTLNDELDRLFALFANIDNKTSGGEFAAGATPGEASFQLKYLKSVQQEEIELIANTTLDASTIIWIHLTNTQSSSMVKSSNGASATTLATLNPVRYSHLFDLLKNKVLTHNYKQIKVNSVGDSADQKQLNSHVHQMNEFLLDSVKRTIDAFVTELDKNLMNSIALRIDKNLALEIHQHNEYYNYLKYTEPCDAHISLNQVEMRFEVILNEYLRDNLKHPLLVYNNDGNLNEVNYFDIFTSKWMSKLFKENRESASSSNEQHTKQIIVYRYCNHTVLSSEVVTLIQSIIHQLSYILELHESFAFENPIKIIDNLAKALETHNRIEGSGSDGEQNSSQIIIILNGLDRILRTQYDLNIFLYFISKLYDERMQSAFNLKLILTLSCSSLFTHLHAQHGSSSLTPVKAPKLISNLIKKLDSQFHNMKPNVKMNIDYHRTLETSSNSVANLNLKDRLMSSLFNSGNLAAGGEASATLNFVVDLLLYLLNETRYGVKQVEIFDLFRNSLTNQNLKNLNRASLAYVLNMAWYTIKYHSIIYPKETNLIELTVDNNQLLFRLDAFTQQQQQHARKPSAIGNKFDDIIYSYYNRSSIKQSSPDIDKQTRLISYFNNRIFHELPKYFYLSDSIDPQEELTFLTEFIFNAKWLINKSFTCSSILYYVHDLVFYRKLFLPEQVDLDYDVDDQMAKTLGQNKAKFIRFERIAYKLLYNLNQDHNQLHLYLKNTKLDGILTNVNYLNRTTSHLPKFVPLNLNYFKHRDSLDGPRSPAEVQLQIDTNQKSVFFSKVVFIDADTFVTLSDAPYNRLKVWKIDPTKPSLIETIRTINFVNKAPKDLRLINKHTAVVLLERNLHLIDLNRCDHVYDLNSTMNPSFAFFELHDSNHVVLLARNRLTVILMKVPQQQQQLATRSCQTSGTDLPGEDQKPTTNTTTASGGKDDMFLFKVGEDRYLKSLIVSRNGKIMVCGDEVQKPFPLLVWNLEHRKLVYDLRQPNHEIITSIQSISSSGKYFVSACQEEGDAKNCLIVYDLSTGQLLRKLKAKFDFVCVELNEESNVIIACLENAQIMVYDLSNGSKKFVINSNRYPINKIKMIDQPYRHRTNYFLTYDTTGIDWTIRLWDMTKGDQLIASVTCPARIISLDLNTAPFYLPATHLDVDYDEIYLIVCLYGVEDLLAIKLNLLDNVNNNSSKVTNTSSSLNTTSASDTLSTSGFTFHDPSLHGLEKSIKL